MAKAVRTICFVVGAIFMLFGLAFENEYYSEIATEVTVPNINAYLIIGAVLLIIGAVVFYLGFRIGVKSGVGLI